MNVPIAKLGSSILLGLALAACSGESTTAPATELPMGTDEMPMASDEITMHDDAGALGEPGDPADADRTINVSGGDQLRWDPDAIEVSVGETITFEIENTGTVDHEFILGSAEFQEEHEQEMEAGEMMMGEPNEARVPVGETVSLTWHFTEPGTTQFGCHEPGHFLAGMVGTITVSG